MTRSQHGHLAQALSSTGRPRRARDGCPGRSSRPAIGFGDDRARDRPRARSTRGVRTMRPPRSSVRPGSWPPAAMPDHRYRWASVTKPMTALTVLVGCERGLLELDEPAGPPGATVRHLLAHASGLAFEGETTLAAPGSATDLLEYGVRPARRAGGRAGRSAVRGRRPRLDPRAARDGRHGARRAAIGRPPRAAAGPCRVRRGVPAPRRSCQT